MSAGSPRPTPLAERDRMIVQMFFEMPSEAFVARMLRIRERDVELALERFASEVAALADAHWRERMLAQLDELEKICERLSELEKPQRITPILRCRIGALRAQFLAAAPEPQRLASRSTERVAEPA